MTTHSLRTAYRRLFVLMAGVFLLGIVLVVLVMNGVIISDRLMRPTLWLGWLLVLMTFPLLFVTGYWWAKTKR